MNWRPARVPAPRASVREAFFSAKVTRLPEYPEKIVAVLKASLPGGRRSISCSSVSSHVGLLGLLLLSFPLREQEDVFAGAPREGASTTEGFPFESLSLGGQLEQSRGLEGGLSSCEGSVQFSCFYPVESFIHALPIPCVNLSSVLAVLCRFLS